MSYSPGSIDPDGLFDGIQWSAVGLGALVDILVTFAANLPLVAIFAPEALTADPARAEQVMREASTSLPFLVAGLLVGMAATVFGAYVGARRAGVHHLRHGGWVAIASLLIGFLPLLLLEPGPEPPLWYQALGIVLMLPAGLLGGFLARPRAVF